MANIQERTTKDGKTHFRVLVRLKGFPIQTATFERKTDAKRWAQQTEAAIREGRHFKTSAAKKHTLGDMIDRYIKHILPTKPKSADVQEGQLNWWKEQIGAYTLCDITPAMIGECRDILLQGKTNKGTLRTPATGVRYLAALSHAFSVAVNEWGWIEDNPVRKVKKPIESRGRVRFLSDDERSALLTACKASNNKALYTIVVLALSTGMRFSEIMNLTWNDIDLTKNFLILHETKNGERRNIPIAGHALELIKELGKIRHLKTILLFPGSDPKKPMHLRVAWSNALSKAGIADFRFHDLRHSAASYFAMNGASATEIAHVLGHKTLQMVKRYAHLSEQHTSKVVASMNEKIFGDSIGA
jgi:integrase